MNLAVRKESIKNF